eukprot:TRINITY_DN9964_c2_g1_i1.p1 TRINITY_DN9964_c2_g1~~TRINITY_DN9964_c2_g1_i1.p1  ORF type:complete len:675 (-),score=124.28 TRINITY_DN9964_c2_g1_i1:164-2188(-)
MSLLATLAAAPPAELVRCSVTVEVNGRAVKPEKNPKVLGVEVRRSSSSMLGEGSASVKVLGFKREIVISSRNLRQISDARISEGRLAITSKDGAQVVLSQAQRSQLEGIVKSLKGQGTSSNSTSSLGASKMSSDLGVRGRSSSSLPLGRPVATPAKLQRTQNVTSNDASQGRVIDPRILIPNWPQEVLEELMSYVPPEVLPRLGEVCKGLDDYVLAPMRTFRITKSHSQSVPPEMVVKRVMRQTSIEVLDLSCYTAFNAAASKQLAEGLLASALRLRILSLHGCKGMSDASVRRLLFSCPQLEILDILEIPRLTNRALQAPLNNLRILAAGTLGKPLSAKQDTARVMEGNVGIVHGGGGKRAPQMQIAQRPDFVSGFTSSLFSQFRSPELEDLTSTPNPKASAASKSAKSAATSVVATPPPLTHLILAHCAEIEVLSKLPATLQHLDLRGASIQVPEAAVAGWKPFASSVHLEVLNLSGNTLLGSRALLACVASLPSRTQLKVLDISSTRAETHFFDSLPNEAQGLTHFRASNCLSLGNSSFATILYSLKELEVLDISGCAALDLQLSELVRVLPAAAAAAAAAASRQAQRIQTLSGGGSAVPATAASTASNNASAANVLAPKLRLLGIGRTLLASSNLDSTRRALVQLAPSAEAVPTALDVFRGYADLPPKFL